MINIFGDNGYNSLILVKQTGKGITTNVSEKILKLPTPIKNQVKTFLEGIIKELK